MPRHQHDEGYATIVLGGRVSDVSFAGRMYAEPGDVLLHGRFDCHLLKDGEGHLRILRLPWFHDAIEGQFRVRDPDTLARLAETDAQRAAAQLHDELRPAARHERHWVDDLADALRENFDFRLQDWAEAHGLRPDTLSHVFHREFGVTPKRFRLEARTRLAWREITRSTRSLTEIACTGGFSDLPHLSRSVQRFTGRRPSDWRAARSSSPSLTLTSPPKPATSYDGASQ